MSKTWNKRVSVFPLSVTHAFFHQEEMAEWVGDVEARHSRVVRSHVSTRGWRRRVLILSSHPSVSSLRVARFESGKGKRQSLMVDIDDQSNRLAFFNHYLLVTHTHTHTHTHTLSLSLSLSLSWNETALESCDKQTRKIRGTVTSSLPLTQTQRLSEADIMNSLS